MPNTRKKLAELVIEEIKQRLRNGEFKEGDKLPNEIEFSRQLGVSRMPLREALHTLQLMGVITQSPRTGTIIVSGNPDLWIPQPPTPRLSDRESIKQLFEAHKIIESATARLSVRRIKEAEIEKLRDKLSAIREAALNKDPQDYISQDYGFHYIFAGASHNVYMLRAYITLFKDIGPFMLEIYRMLPGLLHNSLLFHEELLEAVTEGDEKKAEICVRRYIRMIKKTLENYFFE